MINKVAAQLYTLRDLLQTPRQIADTLKKVKAIGYDAVQVSGIGPIDPKELKTICDDLGLVICATHVGYDDLMNDLPGVIAKHQLWQCIQAALGSLPTEMRSEKGYVEFARKMNIAGEQLAKEGLTLSYHNHAFELQKYGETTGLDMIYDNSDPENLQAEIDTYWIQYGGSDPAWWCRKLAGRLPLVHLKDYGMVDNTPTFMEVGKGNLNWPAIFDACKRAGAVWYPVEQDTCPGCPLDSLETSFQNLQRMLV